jgi:adenosylhomocysteine nucleosidase
MTVESRQKKENGTRKVLIFATRLEAEPFIKSMGAVQFATAPVPLFHKGDMILAISGIGKANAAITTTYCCTTFSVAYVLNLGCAGGASERCEKGDIFLISKVIEPDRPNLRSGRPYVHIPSALPGFAEATLATQDKPVITLEERKSLSVLAELADMEAAAVVQAARRFNVSVLVFKFISDTVSDEASTDIIPYVQEYGTEFCRFILEAVIPRLGEVRPPGQTS